MHFVPPAPGVCTGPSAGWLMNYMKTCFELSLVTAIAPLISSKRAADIVMCAICLVGSSVMSVLTHVFYSLLLS